jgi:HK97 family phage prohead protease
MPPTSVKSPKAKTTLPFAIKDVAPDGSFEGVLAVYNNVDLGGDKIIPGAFTKTIQEHGNQVVMLWQHKTDVPIGTLTLIDGQDALRVKGQFLMDLDDAKKAYALLKARIIKGLSIGYDTVKASVVDGVRQLNELRLWEGSIVTFPMNEMAMVTAVKMRDGKVIESKGDFNEEYAENQLQSAGYQMLDALWTALCSVPWTDGLDDAQKAEVAQTIISQFETAYLAYFPQYLVWLSSLNGNMELMSQLQHERKSFMDRVRGQEPAGITDELKATIAQELKEGRKLSAATKKSIKAAYDLNAKAMGHMKDANDIFDALLDEEAVDNEDDLEDDTLKSKAAANEKPEPVIDHSAAVSSILSKAKESYQWTLSKQN